MAPAPFTALARIVKSHGLKGEVAVEPAANPVAVKLEREVPLDVGGDDRAWAQLLLAEAAEGVIHYLAGRHGAAGANCGTAQPCAQ